MSKEQENLRDKFEEETNLKCWSEPHFDDVGFSDKYVEWLEKQLLLCNVVGRSECEPDDEQTVFNAGFDEGYTSPLETDRKRVTIEEYENHRKECYDVWVSKSEQLCGCDAPIIRTSDKGGEYCGICEKDLD